MTVRRDKSFADDLIVHRGVVSGRVALLLRSAETKPLMPRFVPPMEPPIRMVGPHGRAPERRGVMRGLSLLRVCANIPPGGRDPWVHPRPLPPTIVGVCGRQDLQHNPTRGPGANGRWGGGNGGRLGDWEMGWGKGGSSPLPAPVLLPTKPLPSLPSTPPPPLTPPGGLATGGVLPCPHRLCPNPPPLPPHPCPPCLHPRLRMGGAGRVGGGGWWSVGR